MKIIFPLAGLGSRFKAVADQNQEYKKPKPFISVRGLPMIRWASGSLPFIEFPGKENNHPLAVSPSDLIFVILKEHDIEHDMGRHLKEIFSDNINIVKLDALTRGAAETAYAAREFLDKDEDIIISDSDHYFDGTVLAEAIAKKHGEIAGIIPVFRARNEGIAKWSYSLLKKNSTRIEKVAEKDPDLMNLGAPANIGAYYFSRARYFLDGIEECMAGNITFGQAGKGEFYIAPLYQRLIESGLTVEAVIVKEMWGLGTPSDLEYFLTNSPLQKPII